MKKTTIKIQRMGKRSPEEEKIKDEHI